MVGRIMLKETIKARGHKNVTARHRNTIEFTKEGHLTPRGDCILAVGADKGVSELSEEFKCSLRNDNAEVEITITCSGITDKVMARGNSNLILNHPADIVIRKSDFICSRTLAIKADKAAIDLDRNLIEKLKEGNDVVIEFKIKRLHG